MHDLEILAHPYGQLVILTIKGPLHLSGTAGLLRQVHQAMSASPGRAVVCDLRDLQVGSSDDFLMSFPAAQRRCGPWRGSTLLLAAPSPEVDLAMRRRRIPYFVPTYPTLSEAVDVAERETLANRRVLDFGTEPRTPATARRALSEAWPVNRPGRDRAVYVLQELATNAVVHTRSPISVGWQISSDSALVTVTDPASRPLVVGSGRPDAPSGLGVVAALSAEWGVRQVFPRGKTVWARVMTS